MNTELKRRLMNEAIKYAAFTKDGVTFNDPEIYKAFRDGQESGIRLTAHPSGAGDMQFLSICRNPNCTWCSGIGVFIIKAETTLAVSKYYCYGGTTPAAPFETIYPPESLEYFEGKAPESAMKAVLVEIDEYLSQTLYDNGQPIQLNYIGAGSILHKKVKEAIQSNK